MATENSSFTLTNTAAAAEKTIFTETLGFTLDNSNASIDALLAINPVLTNVNAVHINANPGQVVLVRTIYINTLTADPTDSTQTITSDLSLFEGSGDTDFLFGTSTEQIINGGGGNFVYSGVTTAGGYVEITYDYSNTPNVPEPDSLLLFGTGLLGSAGALALQVCEVPLEIKFGFSSSSKRNGMRLPAFHFFCFPHILFVRTDLAINLIRGAWTGSSTNSQPGRPALQI